MEKEILEKLEDQDKKLDEIRRSLERMRRYFFWKFIITVIIITLPIIGVSFFIPKILNAFYETVGI